MYITKRFLYLLIAVFMAVNLYSDEPVSLPVLSKDTGKITDTYIGKSSNPIVIIIQDMHCNGPIQRSISEILRQLKTQIKEKLYVVGVEGNEGVINTSILRNLPSDKLKETLTQSLVDKGLITGVELYDIENPNNIIIIGVEDKEIYNKNLAQLKDMLFQNDKWKRDFLFLTSRIKADKKRFYSDTLWHLDKLHTKYEKNKISLYAYLDKLRAAADKRGGAPTDIYPNLKQVISANENIKIDQLRLVEEIEDYFYHVKLAACENEHQKEIVFIDRFTMLVESYFENAVSSISSENVEGNMDTFIRAVNKRYRLEIKDLREKLKNAQEFYITARKRNEILVKNLLKQIKERKQAVDNNSLGVILIGGFHTQGIEDVLRSKGCSYITIMPIVKGAPGYTKDLYFERLKNEEGLGGSE
ncbi:MAG: hypothetical protein ABH857_05515 [Elusimicrobiota bacterium]